MRGGARAHVSKATQTLLMASTRPGIEPATVCYEQRHPWSNALTVRRFKLVSLLAWAPDNSAIHGCTHANTHEPGWEADAGRAPHMFSPLAPKSLAP